MLDTITTTATTTEADRIAALERELAAAHERIAELCSRQGPEYMAPSDTELARWLCSAAQEHPEFRDGMAPLDWPAAARAQLLEMISQYHSMDIALERPRGDRLRIAGAIHDLCAANDSGPESTPEELADAIILDDDREWRRLHLGGVQ